MLYIMIEDLEFCNIGNMKENTIQFRLGNIEINNNTSLNVNYPVIASKKSYLKIKNQPIINLLIKNIFNLDKVINYKKIFNFIILGMVFRFCYFKYRKF